jgi:hypothetical protein
MQRIAHILLIVVISMLLWGLPYGLLVAALVRLAFEAVRDQWRLRLAPAVRLG